MVGRLIVAATPIGNLGDVSERLIKALGSADTVLAEDTRVTRKLFTRFGIATPLERCDEEVISRRMPAILDRIRSGETLVFVSDAGTPGISDPGARVVSAALEADLPVEVIPGPAALIVALVASGLPTDRFYFGGFLPRKKGERDRYLSSLGTLDATLIFYESPHRTAATLAALAEAYPQRRAALARELTKLHEEVIRGSIEEVRDEAASRERIKGEVVLLVGPPVEDAKGPADDGKIESLIAQSREAQEKPTALTKRLMAECGLSRDEAYRRAREADPATG